MSKPNNTRISSAAQNFPEDPKNTSQDFIP